MSILASAKKPYRLGPFYHKQLASGASFFQDERGWIRAENFKQPEGEKRQAEENVAFADMSHVTKFSLKGLDMIGTVRDWYSAREPIEPGRVLASTSGVLKESLCCILVRDEATLLANPEAKEAVLGHIGAGGQNCLHVSDISSVQGGLYLVGPRSGDVISKVAELDIRPESFPDFSVAQAPLLRVHGTVLRRDLNGLPGYQIYFERAFGEYMWEMIMNAGREFNIASMGVTALKLLGWGWS